MQWPLIRSNIRSTKSKEFLGRNFTRCNRKKPNKTGCVIYRDICIQAFAECLQGSKVHPRSETDRCTQRGNIFEFLLQNSLARLFWMLNNLCYSFNRFMPPVILFRCLVPSPRAVNADEEVPRPSHSLIIKGRTYLKPVERASVRYLPWNVNTQSLLRRNSSAHFMEAMTRVPTLKVKARPFDKKTAFSSTRTSI